MSESRSEGFEWRTLGRLVGPGVGVAICVWGLWKYTGTGNLPAAFAIVLGILTDLVVRLVLGPSASFIWWITLLRNSPPEDDDEPQQ